MKNQRSSTSMKMLTRAPAVAVARRLEIMERRIMVKGIEGSHVTSVIAWNTFFLIVL